MAKKKNNPFGGKKGRKKNNPYGGKKGSKKAKSQSKPLTTSRLISAIGGRSAQQARPLSRPSFTSPRPAPAAKPVAAAQPAQPPTPPAVSATPQLQPQGIGPSAYTQQFDHSKLATNLRELGKQGGGMGIQGYMDLISMGHSPYALEDAVRAGTKYGLKIGPDLDSYLRSGIDPREAREQSAAGVDAMEAYRAAIEAQTAQALADADALRAQMEDEFRRNQLAAEQRMAAQQEAQRMQLIRERGAGRSANLQIRSQPIARGRGGSTTFRRRGDQFRITPTPTAFKGISGTETANNLVNI